MSHTHSDESAQAQNSSWATTTLVSQPPYSTDTVWKVMVFIVESQIVCILHPYRSPIYHLGWLMHLEGRVSLLNKCNPPLIHNFFQLLWNCHLVSDTVLKIGLGQDQKWVNFLYWGWLDCILGHKGWNWSLLKVSHNSCCLLIFQRIPGIKTNSNWLVHYS